MASAETRRLLNGLRDKYDNNKCFECGTHSPQWVSVNNGVFICLECSGRHRSLGVHLSFVRSVTMDQWKEKEERLMEAGGNSRCRDFLEAHSADYRPDMSIEDKWKTKAAHLWRDKLAADVDGRPWSEQTSSAAHMPLYTPQLQASAASSVSSSFQSSPDPNRYQGFGNSAYSGGSGAYQGGSRQETGNGEDVWTSLSSWGSYLTDVSAIAAQKATAALAETTKVVNDNVIAPTAQKVQEGTLLNDVSKGFWDTTEKVKNSNLMATLTQTTTMATSSLSQTFSSVLGEEGSQDSLGRSRQNGAQPSNSSGWDQGADDSWGRSDDGWEEAPRATEYGSVSTANTTASNASANQNTPQRNNASAMASQPVSKSAIPRASPLPAKPTAARGTSTTANLKDSSWDNDKWSDDDESSWVGGK